MRGTKKSSESILLDAKRIFADSSYYEDVQLMGYYRLIVAIYGTTSNLTNNSIIITGMETVINRQSENIRKIVKLRFFNKFTLEKTAKALDLSRERIRQIEEKFITALQKETEAFCLDEQLGRLQDKIDAINKIKNGESLEYCMPINILNLSTRATNCLMRAGIANINQLLSFSERDFLSLPNMGKCTTKEVMDKINALFPQRVTEKASCSKYSAKTVVNNISYDNEEMAKSIDELGLSLRTYNCLRRNGINTIKQLLETDDEELKSFAMFGEVALKEVKLIKLKYLLNDY